MTNRLLYERREFIAFIGGVAGMASRGSAQQRRRRWWVSERAIGRSIRKVCGGGYQGLKEAGYVNGQNVTIQYRWADGQYDCLPALAAELITQRVAVIVPIGGVPATLAAKAATSTIPIVFNVTADPLELGLVASLNQPGGNATGVTMLGVELEAKRLELLRELVSTSALIAMLVNPNNAQAKAQSRDVQAAASAMHQQVAILDASTEREVEAAFTTLVQQRAGALLVGADTFFTSQPALFVVLTARHAIPAIYPWRSHVDAGGLMSYGASLLDVIGKPASTLAGFSKEKNQQTCRSCSRPNSSW